ncbi:MAG TPA: hypothetical protein VGZ47_19315, partial [Gemmataceae bacterium]|nr:hypothetical protein [Gemmataceae bacterium]
NGLLIRRDTHFQQDVRKLIHFCERTMGNRSFFPPLLPSRSLAPKASLGIVSLLLGLGAAAIEFINLIVAMLMAQQGVNYMAGSIVTLVGLVLSFVGGVLGLIGLLQSNRKKGLAIAGVIVNGLLLVGMLILSCAGGGIK